MGTDTAIDAHKSRTMRRSRVVIKVIVSLGHGVGWTVGPEKDIAIYIAPGWDGSGMQSTSRQIH